MEPNDFTVQALVLAAGKSERMGRDKALLEVRGQSPLEHIAAALPANTHVVVVAGPHNEEAVRRYVGEHEMLAGWVVCVNEQPERGRTSSIQTGLAHLSAFKPFLLWPVDIPLVHPDTVHSLLVATPLSPCCFRIPMCGDRRGHPVLLGRELHALVSALEPDQPLRELMARDDVEVEELTCEDPGILLDLNTPEDLKGLP